MPFCFSSFLFKCSSTTKNTLSSSVNKESASNAGEPGLIPGWGRFPGEGNGNPLQYSSLENPMDRGTWQATVHVVTRTRHNLVTKPPPQKIHHLEIVKNEWIFSLYNIMHSATDNSKPFIESINFMIYFFNYKLLEVAKFLFIWDIRLNIKMR